MIGIVFGKTKITLKYLDIWLGLLLFITLSGGIQLGYMYRYHAICLLSILAVLHILLKKTTKFNAMTMYYPIILAFLLFNAIQGQDIKASLHFFVTFLGLFVFLINDIDDSFWKKYLHIVEIVSIIVAISIVLSAINPNAFVRVFGFIIGSSGGFINRAMVGQYAGLANEIAEAAVLCNYGLAIEWSQILTYGINRKRVIFLFILYVGLALTTKRTLLMASLIIPFAFLLLKKQSATTRFKSILAIMLAVSVGAILLMKVPALHFVLERFSEIKDNDDMGGRSVLWTYSKMMFRDAPLFGIGYGTYNHYFNSNGGNDILNKEWLAYGHNVYLQGLGEMGIIGSCLFWTPIAIVAIIGIFNINKVEKKENKVEYLVWLYILLMYIFYGYTGNCTVYYQQLTMYILSLYKIVSILESNYGIRKYAI